MQHRPNRKLDRGRWSWPLGRVDLSDQELRAYTPVFLGRSAIRIAYSEITDAVVRRSRVGGRLRLRRAGTTGDVTIVTVNDDYRRIAEILAEHRIPIADD